MAVQSFSYEIALLLTKYVGHWAHFVKNKPAAQAAGADPPDEAPLVGKIYLFSRNFWTNTAILMPFRIYNLWKNVKIVCFMTGSTIINRLGVTALWRYLSQTITELIS